MSARYGAYLDEGGDSMALFTRKDELTKAREKLAELTPRRADLTQRSARAESDLMVIAEKVRAGERARAEALADGATPIDDEPALTAQFKAAQKLAGEFAKAVTLIEERFEAARAAVVRAEQADLHHRFASKLAEIAAALSPVSKSVAEALAIWGENERDLPTDLTSPLMAFFGPGRVFDSWLQALHGYTSPPPPPAAPKGHRRVRFVKSFAGYRSFQPGLNHAYSAGEAAGFAPDVARHLVDKGFAVFDEAA